MKTTHVHVNGPLTVQPHFLQKKFGIRLHEEFYGGCLAAQLAFVFSALTGIAEDEFAHVFRREWPYYVPSRGISLSDYYALIKQKFRIKLYADRKQNIDDALATVAQGRCVIAVVSVEDDLDLCFNSSTPPDRRGYVDAAAIERASLSSSAGPLHCYLLIGHDAEEGTAILRENRHHYGFKGYGKMPVDALRKNPDAVAFVEVGVTS